MKLEFKMIEVEFIQDEIYYWLVFTVFSSVLAVFGAIIFVISYKLMIYLRMKRLYRKARSEYLKKNKNEEESENSV